jgi:RNA polymerase sigma-70 factor (ECF subfamily)
MSRQIAGESVSYGSSAEIDKVASLAMPCTDQGWRDRRLADSRLIVQIGQHDRQALSTLYDHYAALVYTFALRMTQDRALAETIVVDVFSAVWQLASSFQIGASVPGWLIGLVRQLATAATQPHGDRARRATHLEKHTIRDHAPSERIADVLNVSHRLEALPAAVRETLELAYYDGLTCPEIATRLREPLSTIEGRLREGLCALSSSSATTRRI